MGKNYLFFSKNTIKIFLNAKNLRLATNWGVAFLRCVDGEIFGGGKEVVAHVVCLTNAIAALAVVKTEG